CLPSSKILVQPISMSIESRHDRTPITQPIQSTGSPWQFPIGRAVAIEGANNNPLPNPAIVPENGRIASPRKEKKGGWPAAAITNQTTG
ncbi:MAG: hypothetical protein WD030_01455, partial [Pirellulales bacterium]